MMIDKETVLEEYYSELTDKLNTLVDIIQKTSNENFDTMERVLWFTEGYLKAIIVDVGSTIKKVSEGN